MPARLLRSWPFLFAAILGLYFITLNITGTDLSHYPGDLGDGRFTMYLLEHAHRFFTGQLSSYWDAGFMVPESQVITYSENMLGSAPFYSVFRMMGMDVIRSFQLWFILMTLLNFGFCYLFLRKCFDNNFAAALGAMVFAFSMALQSQLTHAQTFPRFAIPLVFWLALFFKEKLQARYFFFVILVWVYQLYCSIYTGFMLLIPLSAFLIFAVASQWDVMKRKVRDLRWLSAIMLSFIIGLILLWPLMYPYKLRSGIIQMNDYQNILSSIPTVYSHFFSQPGTLLWKPLQNLALDYPAFWDHQIFAGAVASLSILSFWILMGLNMLKPLKFPRLQSDDSIKILFITSLMCFLLFIRFGDFSLYRLVYHLPGFASMRAIQRIVNIELLFFALATAFVFMLLAPRNPILTTVLFIIFSGLIVLDNYYIKGGASISSRSLSQSRVNSLMDKMNHIPPGSLVSYEPDTLSTRSIYLQLDAMLAAQALNLNTVNAYTGSSPYGYHRYWENMDAEGRLEWFDEKHFSPDTVYIIK